MKKKAEEIYINQFLGKQVGVCFVNKYVGLEVCNKRKRHLFELICKCGRTWNVRADRLKGIKSCGKCLSFVEGSGAFSELYGQYKKRAIKRFGSFPLTKEEFKVIIKQPCHYCGTPPNQKYKKKYMNTSCVYNGLDRFDNSKGYTKENTLPCCKKCNYAKRDYSYDEFVVWIKKLQPLTEKIDIKNKRINKKFPTRSIYFDVDGTIVKWPDHDKNEDFRNDPNAKEFSFLGATYHLLPIEGNIEELKKVYNDGYETVVWSLGSKEWAKEVITKLNLEKYVDVIISKPDYYVDDLKISDFLPDDKRVFKG